MSVAWFIVPYKTDLTDPDKPARVCRMGDYTTLIESDNGKWEEDEILSGHAIVKVVAKRSTINTISSDPLFFKIENTYLDTLLGKLPTDFRDQLFQKIKSLGYSTSVPIHDITVRTLLQKLTHFRSKFVYDKIQKDFIQGSFVFKPSNLIRIDSRVRYGISNNLNLRQF